jgi:hypothetical protein
MRRLSALILTAGLAACGGSTTPANDAAPAAPAAETKPLAAGWTATDGIKTPESVYYDSASGYIFTSQIDGAPDGKDGNGRIAKLNGDGSVVNANFVTGLNAPKGLRVCEGTLWAADLGEVLAIDPGTGAIKSRVSIPDSKLLNDIACDRSMAYVSDMLGNKIYMVMNGAASVVADGDLEHPNGLLVDGDRLIVGGWGSEPKADFSTDVKGHLFAYDLKSKAKTLITAMPIANIDGLEADGRGGYLLTDYLTGVLYHVDAAGQASQIRQLKAGAADIGFVPSSGVLLVPQMNDNQITAVDLSTDLK